MCMTSDLCYMYVYSFSVWLSILEIVQRTVKAKVQEYNRGKESWKNTEITPFEELCMVCRYVWVVCGGGGGGGVQDYGSAPTSSRSSNAINNHEIELQCFKS